jgi:SagB-type dehydrogenase family enzyme
MKRRPPHPESAEEVSRAWYVAEGERGQQLLDHGHVGQATEVFESILARFGDAPSYGKAVLLGRLAQCAHVGGRPDVAVQHVRDAIDVIGRLAPSDGVKALRGTLRSALGDAHRAVGQYDEARKSYEAALKIAEELNDLRGQGVDLGHLGALALSEGRLDEALTRHQAARRLFEQIHEPALEAAAWHQLGKVHHARQERSEAERHYREAARISEARGHLAAAAHTWNNLADLLQNDPDRLVEARQLAERSASVAQSLTPAAPDSWKSYGILADIADKEALAATDAESRTALAVQARDYRDVQRHAPGIFATLARVGESPGYARAVILGHLGRCMHMARRRDLAVTCVRDAISLTDALPPSDGVTGLRGGLYFDLGDMFRAVRQDADATAAHEAALRIAEELQDVRGQASASQRLGRAFQGSRGLGSQQDAEAFEVTIHEDLTTDYVFDTNLVVDGPRQRRVTRWAGTSEAPGDGTRPMLPPSARTWMDEEGAVRVSLPLGEPIVERQPGCTAMSRIQRDVAVLGCPGVLWRLIREMDGTRTSAEMLAALAAPERAVAARMLAVLAATGTIDVSGRPVGRFLHRATKKGVLPAGGLEDEAVLQLATDGNYRAYPEAPRIAVSTSVPDRLRTFHGLTHSRRSSRDYGGPPVGRGTFDALLHTACGVTGAMTWAGRDVQLRAYPSSGALYAVEIYPVVLRVEGLLPAVYHYRASENVLEIVRPGIDPSLIVGAALPVERDMVAGAAALLCLTGCFPRHEQKYGQGGYRMLVAEAGHISQSLILAATALGLNARPFGGVFDDLVNHDLGLNAAEEQFLLAVLVGHTGRRIGGTGPWTRS